MICHSIFRDRVEQVQLITKLSRNTKGTRIKRSPEFKVEDC